jgi:hypothetical protein
VRGGGIGVGREMMARRGVLGRDGRKRRGRGGTAFVFAGLARFGRWRWRGLLLRHPRRRADGGILVVG